MHSRPPPTPKKSPKATSPIGDGEHVKTVASCSPNTKRKNLSSNMADSPNQNKHNGNNKAVLKSIPAKNQEVKSTSEEKSKVAEISKSSVSATKITYENDIDLETAPSDASSVEEFEFYENLIAQKEKAAAENMCGEEYAVENDEFEAPTTPVQYRERTLTSMEPVLESIAEEDSDDESEIEETETLSNYWYAINYALLEDIGEEEERNTKIAVKYEEKKLPVVEHIVQYIPAPQFQVSITVEAPQLEKVEIIEALETEVVPFGIKSSIVRIIRKFTGLKKVERIIRWKSSIQLPVWLKRMTGKVVRKLRIFPRRKTVRAHYCKTLRSSIRMCSKCERLLNGAVL